MMRMKVYRGIVGEMNHVREYGKKVIQIHLTNINPMTDHERESMVKCYLQIFTRRTLARYDNQISV
jgi:hypothetical protein